LPEIIHLYEGYLRENSWVQVKVLGYGGNKCYLTVVKIERFK